MIEKPITIPSHSYEATSNKNILRFVDRDGNWTHYWIKNEKQFVPSITHIIRHGYPKGERFYTYLLNTTPSEAERKLMTAGEEGSRTHEAIRDLIRGEKVTLDRRYFNEVLDRYEPLTHDEWFNLESFLMWCDIYKPRVMRDEETIWSKENSYAGTIDFLGTIEIQKGDKAAPEEAWGKRIFVLIDWKTSAAIWDEYDLQVAAYRCAYLSSAKKMPPEAEGGLWTAIVRLGTGHKKGYEMRLLTPSESDANFKTFKSVLEIYRKKIGKAFEPEIRQIPVELAVRVPKLRIKSKQQSIRSRIIKPDHDGKTR